MSSAALTALAIAEVLQQTLSYLPPLEIVRSQTVSHTWKTVIAESPFLQYRTWQRNNYIDPVRGDDLMHRLDWSNEQLNEYPNTEDQYNTDRFVYNVSTHLHPIVTASILKRRPYDTDETFEFERITNVEGEEYYESSFHFAPVILRELLQWYEKHKDTEERWGCMSLYRPDVRKADWSMPCSDDSGLPFKLEARQADGDDARVETHRDDDDRASKAPTNAPRGLILSDLFGELEGLWDVWIDSEREIHYLSHDAGVCDYSEGFPEYCLDSDNEGSVTETAGSKMTREEHLDDIVERASDYYYLESFEVGGNQSFLAHRPI